MFIPKYLSREQIAGLYKQACEQAEGAVANAWLNSLLNEDIIHKSAYELATTKLKKLEDDLKRLQEIK